MVEPTAHYYHPRASTTARRANSLRENTTTAPVHDHFTTLPSHWDHTISNNVLLTPHQYPASFPSSPFPTFQNRPQYPAAQDASGAPFMTTADPFYSMTNTTSISSPQHLPSPFLALSPGTSSGGSESPLSNYGTADAPEGYYRCECNSILSMLNRSKNHATHEKSSKHRKALGLPRYQSKGLFCRWCDKEFSRHDACNRHQKNCPERPGGKGKKAKTKQARRKARSVSVERDDDAWGQDQYQSISAPIDNANALSPASFPGSSVSPPPLRSQPRLVLSPPTLLSQAGPIPPIFLDTSETLASPLAFHPSIPENGIFFDEPQSIYAEPGTMFTTEPQGMFTAEPQSVYTTEPQGIFSAEPQGIFSPSMSRTPDLYYTGSAALSRLSSMDSFVSDLGQSGGGPSMFPGSVARDSAFAGPALPVVGYPPNSQVFDTANWSEDPFQGAGASIFGQAPYAASPPSYATHHPGRKADYEKTTRRRPS